jgi:MFS superfamily sulfate permease-like transporter
MPEIIQKVPLAALAIILVHTGYKLASPRIFKHIYSQGIEQLAIFVGTLIITLYTNLLVGIFGGLLLTLTIHFLLAKLPLSDFYRSVFKAGSQIIIHKDNSYEIRLKGVANFLGTMKLETLLNEIPPDAKVLIDLSATRLVDFSVMEHLYEFKRNHRLEGGTVELRGLKITSLPALINWL